MVEKNKIEWLRANCPICGKEYEYLPKYKPATCGKFDCLQKAVKQGVLK
jgi:hypothetical protein